MGGWRYPAVTVREQTNICIYLCVYLYISYIFVNWSIYVYPIYTYIFLYVHVTYVLVELQRPHTTSPLKGSRGKKITFFQRNLCWWNIRTLARYIRHWTWRCFEWIWVIYMYIYRKNRIPMHCMSTSLEIFSDQITKNDSPKRQDPDIREELEPITGIFSFLLHPWRLTAGT